MISFAHTLTKHLDHAIMNSEDIAQPGERKKVMSENTKKEIQLWIVAAIIGIAGFKLIEWFLSTDLGNLVIAILWYPLVKLFMWLFGS